MMFFSTLLPLAVFHVLLLGSQTEAADSLLCALVPASADLCSKPQLKVLCPLMCRCIGEWKRTDGRCFRAFPNTDVYNWNSARIFCSLQDLGSPLGSPKADLAAPTDTDLDQFKTFIETHGDTTTDYWIGGSNYYKKDGSKWLSINGANIDYKEPVPGYETCIFINNNQAYDKAHCDETKSVICEKFLY